MTHHQAGGEVELDDEGAEDGLTDDPQRQQPADHRQMAPVGAAVEGEPAGGDHRQADEAGQQPVAVLDDGVDVGGGTVPP